MCINVAMCNASIPWQPIPVHTVPEDIDNVIYNNNYVCM